jgi:cysteinyl-tRNA synthetase
MDLVFPHHENEIAQSHGAHGCAPVRYWMHNGFVNIDNEKMSKSLDNFFTIRTVLGRYHPQTVRLFLLGTHYRHPISYSDHNLDEAAARLTYLYDTLAAIDEALASGIDCEQGPIIEEKVVDAILPGFAQAMDNDFNTPGAIGHLSDVLKLANQVVRMKRKRAGRGRTLALIRTRLAEVSSVLGVLNHDPREVLDSLCAKAILRADIDADHVERLLATRTKARATKDWAEADRVRDELTSLGIEVMDTPTGTTWRPAIRALDP